MSVDLELATVDQISDELHRRFDAGYLLATCDLRGREMCVFFSADIDPVMLAEHVLAAVRDPTSVERTRVPPGDES